MKKGILVVTFGTTSLKARQATTNKIIKKAKEQFPDFLVQGAFTSRKVMDKISNQEHTNIEYLDDAIQKLKQKECRELYVEPLYLTESNDLAKLQTVIHGYDADFQKIVFGDPLLTTVNDFKDFAIFLNSVGDLKLDEGNLFIGHGTAKSNRFILHTTLDYMMLDTNSFVGTVESYPDLGSIMQRMRIKNIQRVHLYPLMLVAGIHASKDIVSGEKGTWNKMLMDGGFETTGQLIGLGEYEFVQNKFISNLKRVVEVSR
ncbi:sirohydrochlorin cobaltochelatase [Pediococcus claussenii]|uniref:Sirohydrochlorin cobaltochelatase 2 n=1 Tax=Pediococcus claussenii (strain ATCC BAA-344 / DSM 14800 / JCM 18046 / KCTC 3811 / LMG 21948 / P06) TaxID=701521 RepID=G8PEK5_PEDCP|nr:sirohydrochlorin cobaltochelatase [Pediococcus claussenii]AEV95614.1 sirohydrochlorin cobaltochelatase 2 [Pediococcus claussenii ATCC BAA-344]ANZ69134.1 hypothetical protein AYR57_01925 [Pediococcus claussenii]ANZ70951.1 hypothetical protein AYR58_01925 [Pediococcus claussenii]KRN20153.1 cbiK protein [Pediococcus claussenii]